MSSTPAFMLMLVPVLETVLCILKATSKTTHFCFSKTKNRLSMTDQIKAGNCHFNNVAYGNSDVMT